MGFDIALDLLVPIAALASLALASWRWGYDSRDGFDVRPHSGF
jgi:hypothetical protein